MNKYTNKYYIYIFLDRLSNKYTKIYKHIQKYRKSNIIIYIQIMEQEAENRDRQRNRQIIFIIAIYLMLTLSGKDNNQQTNTNSNIKQKIKNPGIQLPTINQLFSIFTEDQYMGVWSSRQRSDPDILHNKQGKFRLRVSRWGSSPTISHGLRLTLNDGQYIDEGTLLLWIEIASQNWQIKRDQQQQVQLLYKSQTQQNTTQIQPQTLLYQHNILLQNKEHTRINTTDFTIYFAYDDMTDSIHIKMNIQCQVISAQLLVIKSASNIFRIIIFAIVLSVIAYLEFSAIMGIYKSIFDGAQSLVNFSVITVLICTLWDAVICLFSFAQAFSDSESLLLFIVPSFIFCLLFINLQLRLIFMIFQANIGEGHVRELICKFNLVSYGGLILIYPLLYYTNLSMYFFIGVSLLLVSQILLNGQNGVRPKLTTPYYKHFVPIRFLLILYLKANPWNHYELEPDYLLVFSCGALLVCQYFLLRVQRVYGPRTFLPSILLPEIFNYECQIDQNVEEGVQMEQCSICLTGLTTDIPEANDARIPYKVMKSPCGHKYHGYCLSKWMQIKKQCPQCRTKLPPFQ